MTEDLPNAPKRPAIASPSREKMEGGGGRLLLSSSDGPCLVLSELPEFPELRELPGLLLSPELPSSSLLDCPAVEDVRED